jgi:hypothetical protein
MKDITPETILCPVCKWQWDNKNQNCPNCNFPIAQFKDLLAGKRILSDDDLIKEFHNELEKAKKVYEERKTKLTQPTKNKLSLYWEEILDEIKEFVKENGFLFIILLGFFILPITFISSNLVPKESRILTKILYAILATILGTILGAIGNALIVAIISILLSKLLSESLSIFTASVMTFLMSNSFLLIMVLVVLEPEFEKFDILKSILTPIKNKILKSIFGFIYGLILGGILGIIIGGFYYMIFLLLLSILPQSVETVDPIDILIFGFSVSLIFAIVYAFIGLTKK